MKEETKPWLDIAEGDYDSALYLLERARYPQAIYLLCQAIEKVLKAAQIEFADTVPKKIHRLENIAKQTNLMFSEDQYEQLEELSKHYGKVRYPDFAQKDYNTKQKVMPIIAEAKELYLWIHKKFKNH